MLRGLTGLLWFLSVAFIALFFFVAFQRVRFPLQLEWLEGGVLDTSARVLHHQPVYVQPTYRFIPFLYTPFFYYMGALALRLGGPALRSLRMLSIASTAGCFLLLFVQTRSIARSRTAGILAAGLFAALYGAVDGWYDLARVDMLCLLLTLLAIGLSYRGQAVLAALAFVLAYQTKQGAGIIAVFVLLHELERPRKLVAGMATFLAGTLASVVYLNRMSGGWYDYYTLHLPSHHALVPETLALFWTRDLFSHLGLALAVIGLGVLVSPWKEGRHRRLCHFLLATTAGMLISAISGRLHSGGGVNSLLPLYAWICVLFGIAIAAIRRMDSAWVSSPCGVQVVFLGMCAMQLAQLVYPANRLIPPRHANQEAQAALDRIAALPGDFFIFNNCVDLTPIGKVSFANSNAIWDVMRGDHGPAAIALQQSLNAAVTQHVFAGVIANGGLGDGFPYAGAPAQVGVEYDGKTAALIPLGEAKDLESIVPPLVEPTVVHYARPPVRP